MVAVDGLRSIVQKPGFIHTLCIIIANETLFHSPEAVRSRNRFELVSHHEITLLISLLSETQVDLTVPSHEEIEEQYIQCKRELDAVHGALIALSQSADIANLFTDGRHFIEPIFYTTSSAFWFDYLDLAPQVYDLDRQFLLDRGYNIAAFSNLLREMHDLFRDRIRNFIRMQRRRVRKGGIVQSPLECFLFSPDDFDPEHSINFSHFVERFSVRAGENPAVKDPIIYHPAKARPALQLSNNKTFVPLVPILCERLFENPFYVIVSDAAYFGVNANNRGIAAECTTHKLLQKIKGLNLLTDVRLYRGSEVVDQIDIVAAFGATAIIFEIKTKRLTEASKQGDTAKLIEDVRQGITDAKQQLESSKAFLLSKLYDRATAQSGDVELLAHVSRVICVSVMTHEIPAYSLIIRTILEKEDIVGIIPIGIFDLKIMTHYLSDAFEFLYYFAVRSLLDRHLMYNSECSLLGYHLKTRLNVPENADMILIDDSIGQQIDADYPLKVPKLSLEFGVDLVDEVVRQVKETGDPMLFHLFSVFRGMSGSSAKEAKELLRKIEKMALEDERAHDATIAFNKVALTFIFSESATDAEHHCEALMFKRDTEQKFEQEYIVILSGGSDKRTDRNPARFAARNAGSHRFAIRGVAMKQRKAGDDSLIAFSPRLPQDTWKIERQ